MALKKVEAEIPISRFKEFQEASRYIEAFEEYSEEEVFAAIDYMLVHKEFHYLLRTLLQQCQKKDIEKLSSYIFARLNCLKREEDQQLLQELLACQNRGIQHNTIAYILACCEHYDTAKLLQNYPISKEELKILVKYGDCESVHNYATRLQEELFERLRILEEFFEIYDQKRTYE
ncbi:hypothetical protein NitYY0826_C0319 [Nitratiruptor sp. YY08-26]|uniref:hypothetical protein n=1 Tax=unclassified Nitratiruptor TaxID=2624044 RepID=UPI0019158A44|nr:MULTISPECIES: hypothetical protein [unclassified Nitratiruptor]BCD61467.1 hypothetical protein NitYY0813_C0318 [Nitratiruptor sp. YY08-13]BCD65401.1 hypothetical protein NitYY0826_C0319 [Nitratiruptor sp. YY08-26]